MVHLLSAPILVSGHSQNDAMFTPPPPPHQRHISVRHWHQDLGDLWFMALSLPGAICMFSHIQEALRHVNGNRVTLTRGVHATLSDFWWMA